MKNVDAAAVEGESTRRVLVRTRGQRLAGQRALVELVADGIACYLHVRSSNSHEQSATYELVISNKTDVGISCRLYGIDSSAHTREFGMLTIGKRSAGNSFFSIPLATGDRRRLFVEVIGDGVNLFAEALQPAASTQAHWSKALIASALLASATVLGAVYFVEKPSITGLSIPSPAAPGDVTAVYAVGGSARTQYRATLSDGTVFAKGALPASSGQLTIRVPAGAAGQTVHLALYASGPFGHAERKANLDVVSDSVTAMETTIDRGSGLPAVTGVPSVIGKAPASAAVFSVPVRVVAGEPFKVLIKHSFPGLRIALKDGLQATVDDTLVPAHADSISFTAPAAIDAQTYSLVGTFMRGASKETFIQSLPIFPR